MGISWRWSLVAQVIAVLGVFPLGMLITQAHWSDGQVFQQLADTVLPHYIGQSILLVLLVCFVTAVLGIPAAWLVSRFEFFGRRYFQWALLLPLAMPAYISAYVYTDLLDYAGPIQRLLRHTFQWQSVNDYYFPSIRSLGGAALVLALVLFPYVYLLARSAFMMPAANLSKAAQLMGLNPWQRFHRVHLQIARPAIIAGLMLVAMETAADFATVSYFSVQTLTVAVYDAWLGYGSLTAAAKLSVIILLMIFMLVMVEQYARRRQRFYQNQSSIDTASPIVLTKKAAWMACGFCFSLLFFGFLLPVGILLSYVWQYFSESWQVELWLYSLNSFMLALLVSVSCVLLALCLLFVRRMSHRRHDGTPSKIMSVGYAVPGTVLAVAVLLPLTQADFVINDLAEFLGFQPVGLILSGSLFALVFALSIRLVTISLGSIQANYQKISPSMDKAAILLGCKGIECFKQVHLPLLRTGIIVGTILVFIEAMKELPAVMLLRPIGYENLATYVYQFVSDEQLELAALPALIIVLIGLIPVVVLNTSLSQRK